MIPTLTAALITLAGSPVATPPADICDPPVIVTNCVAMQLPQETNGRQIDTSNGVGTMENGKVTDPSPTPTHPVPTPRRPTHPHATPATSARPLPRAAVVVFEDAIRAFLGDDVYHWRIKPE